MADLLLEGPWSTTPSLDRLVVWSRMSVALAPVLDREAPGQALDQCAALVLCLLTLVDARPGKGSQGRMADAVELLRAIDEVLVTTGALQAEEDTDDD